MRSLKQILKKTITGKTIMGKGMCSLTSSYLEAMHVIREQFVLIHLCTKIPFCFGSKAVSPLQFIFDFWWFFLPNKILNLKTIWSRQPLHLFRWSCCILGILDLDILMCIAIYLFDTSKAYATLFGDQGTTWNNTQYLHLHCTW